ncbi:hypothetical protein OS493_026539 [Desmophyllum pertusum]|uniref:Uncharacterized protein n=1 Tax=Desmophyllum pertusum TaxID=174260 RepID=A0A9W9YL00_9CNID|nr:hypothetical protein OS493_026539 [Desmophyllum pertusum]
MSYEHHAARLAIVESVQPRQIPLVDDAVSSRVSSDFTLEVPSHVPSERQKNVKRAEKEINQELEDLYQLRFGKDEEMSIQATTAVTENTVLLKKYPYDEVTSKEFVEGGGIHEM